MIRSFKDRRLKRLHEAGEGSRLQPEHLEKVENILFALDNAKRIEDVDLPGFRLHPLKGDLKGFWSVTVRANWRIVFRFENGDAFDLELTDYH
jgi:proteic killer suppression protein